MHTQFEMPKPVSGAGQKTSLEDRERGFEEGTGGSLGTVGDQALRSGIGRDQEGIRTASRDRKGCNRGGQFSRSEKFIY